MLSPWKKSFDKPRCILKSRDITKNALYSQSYGFSSSHVWMWRIALKHVYYLGWNSSPAQAGCMRQVLGPGALGRHRGMGWRGRWEGGSGWGICVTPWLIHVNVWQKPLQYCKVISLQLKKKRKLRAEELMLLNCGVEDSWESLGQ